ncbi:MAG: hypothetical protein K9L76_00130 [Candidatus Omnitrophica bacterium]|nr:hypothetical protein [Candidatus Omnitrophota bacterium]
MGQAGIYKCNNCGNKFEAREGGGFCFIEYRCVKCDTIKNISHSRCVPLKEYIPPSKEKIGVCKKCGGELREDIKPMCPKCRSRDTEISGEGIEVNYD